MKNPNKYASDYHVSSCVRVSIQTSCSAFFSDRLFEQLTCQLKNKVNNTLHLKQNFVRFEIWMITQSSFKWKVEALSITKSTHNSRVVLIRPQGPITLRHSATQCTDVIMSKQFFLHILLIILVHFWMLSKRFNLLSTKLLAERDGGAGDEPVAL